MIAAGVTLSGRYQLQRKIGVEAGADLWTAHDTRLDRRVLLKMLHQTPGLDDAAAVERASDDVRAAVRGAANSGARVLDAGVDPIANSPYVVFELEQELPQGAAEDSASDPSRARSARQTRPPQVRSRATRQAGQRSQWLMLLLVLVPLALGALLIRYFLLLPPPVPASSGLFSLSATAVAATPIASAVPASRPAPTAQPSPVPTAAPAVQRPTASAAPAAGERRRVANTDGLGVALRATPGGDKLPGKGYDEGVSLTLLEVQGTWAHIRGDDGREGWVLAVTLVP